MSTCLPEAIFRQLWSPRDYINMDPLHFWIGPFTFNHSVSILHQQWFGTRRCSAHHSAGAASCSHGWIMIYCDECCMGWVFRLSGDEQLGAIALPLPMLHHDDRQAALHLQDESEHTMGQGTLSSEVVELQNHFCFWDSIACLQPLGGRLISLLLYACVLGRLVYYWILFCRLGCSETQGLNLRK